MYVHFEPPDLSISLECSFVTTAGYLREEELELLLELEELDFAELEALLDGVFVAEAGVPEHPAPQ